MKIKIISSKGDNRMIIVEKTNDKGIKEYYTRHIKRVNGYWQGVACIENPKRDQFVAFDLE